MDVEEVQQAEKAYIALTVIASRLVARKSAGQEQDKQRCRQAEQLVRSQGVLSELYGHLSKIIPSDLRQIIKDLPCNPPSWTIE